MARDRATLDADGDPEEIGKWTADVKAQRLRAEQDLSQATTATMTRRPRSDAVATRAPAPPSLDAGQDPSQAEDHHREAEKNLIPSLGGVPSIPLCLASLDVRRTGMA